MPIKVVSQSQSSIRESNIIEFSKEVKIAISYVSKDNEVVKSAGLESVKSIQSFDGLFIKVVDKKRYAICNRRKEAL